MPPTRKFKKFKNRKLYDLDGSRYVSMVDLANTVALGDDVTVVEDRTGRDITFQTLARALYERVTGYYHARDARKGVPGEPFARASLAKLIRSIP
jgi:hypothetical protein